RDRSPRSRRPPPRAARLRPGAPRGPTAGRASPALLLAAGGRGASQRGRSPAGGGAVRIVVQKFGGTSVVTPAARRNVTARIREALAEGLHVVAVVSAMGRAGDPYATDTLLGLLGDDGGAEADPRERDLLAAC